MQKGFMTATRPWLLIGVLTAGLALRAGATDDARESAGLPGAPHGKTTMSAEELREVQSLPPAEQRRRLDIVVTAHPEDLTARFLRMQAEVDLNDYSAAVADSDPILSSPFLDGPTQQLTLEWRAECLLHLRRFDESIAAANQVLALYPSSAEALFTRGWARFLAGQRDGVIPDLDRALEISPNEGIGYSRRGTVLVEQGKFDLAAKDYQRAIELAPEDAPSHRQYGILLYRTRDYERAMAQFDAAVRLAPNDVFTLAWRAQGNRVLMRFDAAAADDKQAQDLARSGDDLIHALNNIAIDLESLQDYAGAISQTAHMLALRVDPPAAADMARLLWFSGRFGQAVESFRKYGVSPMSDDYALLWLFVVRGRADPSQEPAAKAELAAAARAHQPHAWTDTLVDMALGKSTLEAALAEADAAETDRLRAGHRCEADYYAAEQMLMHAQIELASRLLEEAHRVCPSTYMEAGAVEAQRRLLAEGSPAR